MNRPLVERVAEAVLYEGHILYPYRPALKRRQRGIFGGLYPEASDLAQDGTEPSFMQTECLVRVTPRTRLEVSIRFLHLTARTVAQLEQPVRELGGHEPPMRLVDALQVDDRLWQTWQEAVERRVTLTIGAVARLVQEPHTHAFHFPAESPTEWLRNRAGAIVGQLRRRRHALTGAVEIAAEEVDATLYRLRVRVVNRTPPAPAPAPLPDRQQAVLRALVATHAILHVQDGAFVSLLDPPHNMRAATAACRNIGVWPVLVGEAGTTDTLLAAPILLDDYPQAAPESPGDFFDGTEIDDKLALRILTLIDDQRQANGFQYDEKSRMRGSRAAGLASGLSESRVPFGTNRL
jgi:hydrogenase maturation protease